MILVAFCRRRFNGTKDGDYGSRIPAVWIGTDGVNQIATALGSNWNHYFTPSEAYSYSTGKWVSLRISQIDGLYVCYVNGQAVHSAVNINSKVWLSVMVIIGRGKLISFLDLFEK